MIEIKSITSGYGKKNIINNLSITFNKGKLTSIIGPNGSGKSTLLKTILGIAAPTSGRVIIDSTDISSLSRNSLAKKISYLPQGRDTPQMTVMQLVLHGRFPYLKYPRIYANNDKEIAYRAMERVGISGLADESLSSLSGGMRQNAYIAMALAQDTDYILLDEPASYLDISHQIELMKILRSLADEGKGIVSVMHDLPMAFTFSDDIVVIDKGCAAFIGSPDDVCKSGIISDIFGAAVHYERGKYCYEFQT